MTVTTTHPSPLPVLTREEFDLPGLRAKIDERFGPVVLVMEATNPYGPAGRVDTFDVVLAVDSIGGMRTLAALVSFVAHQGYIVRSQTVIGDGPIPSRYIGSILVDGDRRWAW